MAGSCFEWTDVTYGVGVGKKSKEILKGISGKLGGGQICGIIGPSGSGKTSLLNILANRVRNKGNQQRVGGKILLNGSALEGAELRKRIAYVMQQDLLAPMQTPREALRFSAMLRLPRSTSIQEKYEVAEEMLGALGLQDCADTYIGDEMHRGISGGEKKRTSIGVELVMRPRLIFLDEPTSGLDSYAAYSVVNTLCELATKDGCNVLTTIHQPSSEIFHSFNSTLLIRKGHLIFFGSIADLSSGFASFGKACPAEYNLADHAMFLLQTESDESLDGLREHFKKISLNDSSAAPEEEQVVNVDREAAESKPVHAGDQRSAGFATQLVHLSKREFQSVWRNKPGFVASMIIPVLLNLFFALIFTKVGDYHDSDWSINSHFGGMVQILIGGVFGSAQPILLRFPLDRGIFLREYATSTYGALSYFLSRTIVELPQSFLIACLVFTSTYWVMDLNGPWINFVLIYWVSGMAASSTALLAGCLAANPEVAIQSAPVLFVPQLMFAGFFIRTEQIPVYLRWAQYLCGLKYGVNLMILNEFGEDTSSTWPLDKQMLGQALIDNNDIDPDRWWVYLLILMGLIVGFRILAITVLARRASSFF